MRYLLPALALCLLGLGCDRTPSSDPATGASDGKAAATTQADPTLAKLLDRLGDGAPLVGVVDPAGWQTVHARLSTIIGRIPGGLGAEFATLKTPAAVAERVLGAIFDRPVTLTGLDPARPIVGAFFEPGVHGPPGAAVATIDFSKPVPLRHEIILPASDPSALVAALTGVMGDTPKTAQGFDMGITQVGVKAEGDVVRIAVLMPAGVEQAELLWRTPARPSARTPAFIELASQGAAAGVLVRPWRMRTAWGQHGASQMAFAMADAPADMRMQLFAAGLAIVLNGAHLMHAERPEFEDAVLRLTADAAGLAFEGTHALTALLRDALDAGAPGRIFALKTKAPVVSWQRVDWRTLIDNVGPRPVFAKARRMRDIARGWQECGAGCLLHTALRAPFGTARGMLDLAPPEVKAALTHLPTSTQIAFLGVDGRRPRIAIAADVPKAFDTGMLREAAPRGRAEVHLIPSGERAALLVGVGVDPRTVFDVEQVTSADGVGRADVDVQTIAGLLSRVGVPAEPFVAGLGPVILEARRPKGAAALRWRLHLTTEAGQTATALKPRRWPAFGGPLRSFAPGKGDACLAQAMRGTAAVFDALASVAADRRDALFAKGIAEVEAQLTCAEAAPETKPAAVGLRRLYVQLMSAGAEGGRTAGALAFAEAQCAASKDARICAEVDRIKAMPQFTLPSVKLHCGQVWGGGRTIQITPKGITLDGRAADLRLIGALREPVVIVADKDLPFSMIEPVLRAAPKETVHLRVEVDGRPRNILTHAPFAQSAPPPPKDDTFVIEAHKDEPYAEIIKRMDAARAAGKTNIVLKVAKDDVIIAPAPDRFEKLMNTPAATRPHRARFRVDVTQGMVKVFDVPRGQIEATGPIERGDAVRRLIGASDADIAVEPDVKWGEAVQVLATVCERGRLIATNTPRPDPIAKTTGLSGLLGQADLQDSLADALGKPNAVGGKLPTISGRVQSGAPVLEGTRDKASIQRVVRRNRAQVRYCYERELTKNPKLAGKLRTSFTIAPDGRVSAVDIDTSGSMGPVAQCMERKIKRWRFPKAEVMTKITYPFIFTAE